MRIRFATTLLPIIVTAVVPVHRLEAQRPARRPAAPAAAPGTVLPTQAQSAQIFNVRYDLGFTRLTAMSRTLHVTMRFDVSGTDPVLLSLPAWTPGAYDLSYFARNVTGFSAASSGIELRWDKIDYDTWRVFPRGPGAVQVEFDYLADSLDNAMAWARSDFLMVNGTNVFMYPEGRPLDFRATVTVTTEPDWLVATGMRPAGAPRTYAESSYHDLVDMPFFIGRLDVDSVIVAGRWTRMASWPAGSFAGARRERLWREIRAMVPPMAQAMGDVPWDTYTVLLIFEPSYRGGSALEHQNSHVGIYGPFLMGTEVLANITAHEIFHAWNVKRLRPAELVPYRYDVAQPTTSLWISEGFTNYYADLAMVRGGLVDSLRFTRMQWEHATSWLQGPPVALEDASLSTWIQPVDGTAYVYYDKGGLAGWLLDILIRDATDNRSSLDSALRDLYANTYRRGRGFTPDEFWAAVSRAAGGRDFSQFRERYVDGREMFPWSEVLPLGGWRWVTTVVREPRLMIGTSTDSTGTRITAIEPGGVMAEAGARIGDQIMRVGDVEIRNAGSFALFRARYANREGESLAVVVRRDGQELTLNARVHLVPREEHRIELDPNPGERAMRVRQGILTGRQDR